MIIVADSGPIISFARAGRLDLLKQVTTELIIPDAVFEEIVVSGDDRPGAEEVKHGLWIKRATLQDRSLLESMPGKLSPGESEAIVLAKELSAHLLVDELEARKEASRLGINLFREPTNHQRSEGPWGHIESKNGSCRFDCIEHLPR
jgi:uncharacterized protein